MIFNNRAEAAYALADKLKEYKGKHPLILAIPRGAVPMAKIIADKLGGSFDVVLVRKLRAPDYQELAIGSVDESGWTYIADYAASVGADSAYIEAEKKIQLDIIKKRRAQYTPIRPHINPTGRIVIVIDDGLATGATMISALHGLHNQKVAKLICAVPVSPPATLKKVAELVDELVCLSAPNDFHAVGQFYLNFPQVEDEEVIEILQSAQQPPINVNMYESHSQAPYT
ncbi:putative phosphoribosyl transferasec [mine drainage metagenome]|uniref:Putative phosphoribosyl transferasec n=1 Tax=mine drainage metagenome TaxID=410659 RepID=A0A1J5TZW7_9ZZZZ